MGTVLFVHGTGVRENQFAATYDVVQDGLRSIRPDLASRPCFWGREFGARIRGASIPEYPAASNVSAQDEAQAREEARWAMLELDPLYELRVLGVRAPDILHLPLDHPATRLRDDLAALATDADLSEVVHEHGLGDHWALALDDVIQSSEFQRAIVFAEDGAVRERRAVTRALVACAQQRSAERDGFLLGFQEREVLIAATVHALGADIAGVISDALMWTRNAILGSTTATLAPAGTWFVARRRAAISDATTPMAGDILVYQSRGADIRAYIKDAIESIDDEVTVLAHSLGGIASVDLLVSNQLPQVKGLVTVGSQAPFLHEIGALWSLEHDAQLPSHFPRWLNIYDRKDFLSFVGNLVFPGRVDDTLVDNRCSFPRSHSAYWTNPNVWDRLGAWLA